MTDAPHEDASREEPAAEAGSFPADAAEMANETEVEADLDPLAEPPLVEQPLVEEVAQQPSRDLQGELDERTADLKRVQAEFLNYKRRVDRDRELVKQNATYTALAPITEVLDTIDRARESAAQSDSEIDGGLRAVADQLERVVATAGLIKFGQPGDAFDPTIHEALSHIGEDPDVTVTTAKVIAKAGYRIGDRVVRAAQVLVVDPAGDAGSPEQ